MSIQEQVIAIRRAAGLWVEILTTDPVTKARAPFIFYPVNAAAKAAYVAKAKARGTFIQEG